MTKYAVVCEGVAGRTEIEAGGVYAGPDWITFHRGGECKGDNIVAVFPADKIVSVVAL
jgi:hypothetical protein